MPFQLTPDSLRETAQTGAAFAELLASAIKAADESRRSAMIEAACSHMRKSVATVTNALKNVGADEFQIRELHDAAEIGFSDRLVELLNPTN